MIETEDVSGSDAFGQENESSFTRRTGGMTTTTGTTTTTGMAND
jgi:hypothetical protein